MEFHLNSVTHLNWTIVFEWWVVRCQSNMWNGYNKHSFMFTYLLVKIPSYLWMLLGSLRVWTYGLGNQSEESWWWAAGEASHPPTRVGYQSQLINSCTISENHGWYCAFVDEQLWQVLTITMLIDERSIMNVKSGSQVNDLSSILWLAICVPLFRITPAPLPYSPPPPYLNLNTTTFDFENLNYEWKLVNSNYQTPKIASWSSQLAL